MSLIDTKKKMLVKKAETYINMLCAKCPELADISTAEMYDLPDWSLPIEKFEKELSDTLKKWKGKYDKIKSRTAE